MLKRASGLIGLIALSDRYSDCRFAPVILATLVFPSELELGNNKKCGALLGEAQ